VHYQFSYHLYQRPFRQPLITSHGQWSVRTGIIICLQAATGDRYWGEIAPIPWFGSETLTTAAEFCRSLNGSWSAATVIPDSLPACQFAWSSALRYGHNLSIDPPATIINPHWSILLPSGAAALHSWQASWAQGHRTFKWKIGIADIDRELEILAQLLAQLPQTVQIRLDANGGLSYEQTTIWLTQCAQWPQVEFIEQPLMDLPALIDLADRYPTPLALDELVSNLTQLQNCYHQGWRGIFVIKPAIAGALDRVANFIQQQQLDVVCSSSLESAVGQSAIEQWAKEHGFDRRAMGMGVQHWFADDCQPLSLDLHSPVQSPPFPT
jgi:o-succinylbenzoate synthase